MCGERELAFFPGAARGSAFPGFDYETEAGAVAAALLFEPPPKQRAGAPVDPDSAAETGSDKEGGAAGAVVPCHAPARAEPGGSANPCSPAQTSTALGVGQLVQQLMPWRSGAANAASDSAHLPCEALSSEWVVVSRQDAEEAAEPDSGGAEGFPAMLAGASDCDRAGSAPREWERCVDYCNGGPMFCPDANPRQYPTDPESAAAFRVLAEYEELGGAIAAVRCTVGGGRAVLCGTHPELAPHWLDAACEADGEPVMCAGAAGTDETDVGPGVQPGGRGWSVRAAGVRAALARDGPARQRLWRMLLAEAGLRESGLT